MTDRHASQPSGAASPHAGAAGVWVRHTGAPGRTRLRLDPDIHSAAVLQAGARRLSLHPAVRSISTNPVILSLLVEHDPELSADALAVAVHQALGASMSAGERLRTQAGAGPAWHALSPAAVLSVLASGPDGLTSEEAAARVALYGSNTLPAPVHRSASTIFVDQFQSLPVLLLLGTAGLSLVSGGVLEAAMTLAVLGLNAGIGFSTETSTENLIRRLMRPEDPVISVRRRGQALRLRADGVAPGDIITLSPGMPVAADARLIETDELAVDQSVITGESYPARKNADASLSPATPLSGRNTMVHRGGVVSGGRGAAVVTATGLDTEIGHMQRLMATVRPPKAPTERELERLGVILAAGCLAAGAGLMILLKARGAPWISVIRSGIALAVSAIPEGLPAIAATSKASAANVLAREGVLVRNLAALETAGAVDILCLDKTGTLTEGRMAACVVRSYRSRHAIDPLSLAASPPLGPDSRALARVAVLCNDAEVRLDGEISGSGTEAALLSLAIAAGSSPDSLRAEAPRIDAWYRNPSRSYMATEHACSQGAFIAVKGAPEQVLALCSTVLVGGRPKPLTPRMRQSILRQNEELAAEGLRILGFAQRHDGSLKTAPLSDLHWLGLVGLEDPLRAGAGELVSSFQEAGIRPLILTGDQASTAKALAARLGVSNDGSLDVVDAAELHELSDEEVAALALRAEVFARVTPGDKLRIVQALQAGGHVVAMTGDGVNDGPALRAADIGIAMGRSGSQITKDVADVVIAEDGLAGIASFLAHGRAAEENIRRSLRFLLGTNASEVILLLLEAISGANELETPFELLWLNLVTDVFPALGLAHAGPADDVLKRQPRPANHLLLDRREYGALAGAATSMAMQGMTAHILGMARYGIGPRARGMTLLALGAAHLSHTLMLAPQRGKRTSETLLSRWGVEAGVAASAALLLAPYAIRPLGRLLGIARPRMSDMALSLTIAGAPLAMHLLKQLRPDPQPEPMIGWRPGRASD